MIDLEKIDQEIENLLNSETTESLTSWLIQHREKHFLAQYGDGNFSELPELSFQFSACEKQYEFKAEPDQTIIQFNMAA